MNRRLVRNLVIPVVPISVFLLGLGVGAALWVQNLHEHVSRNVLENVSAMRAAEEVGILVRDFRTGVEHYRMTEDRNYLDTVGVFRKEMDRWIAEEERWSFSSHELDLTGRTRRGWESLREVMERIARQPDILTPRDFDRLESILTQEILRPTHEFLDLNEAEVEQSVRENQALFEVLYFGFLLLGISGAGTGLVLGFLLARRFIARLEQNERAALQAEQLAALGQLAAGMAHELRNPLTTIKMLVQAVLTDKDFTVGEETGSYSGPALVGRDLTVVDEEVNRLEGIVCSFLDFARPPLPERRVVEVISLVETTLALLAGRAAAAGTTETAIEAMKRGAYEYLLKPLDVGQLRELIKHALELSRFRHVPAVFDTGEDSGEGERIVGQSLAMQEVYKTIGRAAPSEVTVLITGESGTGKELVARALWQHSNRADKTFLVINCAAIPESLLESELFGHEKGAFTGADRRRIGRFEQANRGTLFLDEVADLPPGTQAKLLRVLQEQCFARVGGEEIIRTDVRLLAATNKDLEKEVAAGRFRSDLFFRLNVFNLRLPPLRERREDIPLLIDHFVHVLAGTMGRGISNISPEVRACLADYDWPGNVRQLQSVVKYAIIQASGKMLTLECLPEILFRKGLEPNAQEGKAQLPDVAARTTKLLQYGNQVQASELLGISRTTLRGKLRTLKLNPETYPTLGPGPTGI